MNPVRWLVCAILALIGIFIAAAVLHTITEVHREFSPKRRTYQDLDSPTPIPRLAYGESKDRECHGSQR